MKLKALSAAFVALVLIQVASAFAFAFSGHYAANGFDCRELMSSGGDDEVMMLAFVALLASAVIRLFRFQAFPRFAEVAVYIALTIACGFFSSLFNGCGNLASTLVVPEPFLLIFVISGVLAIALIISLWRTRNSPALDTDAGVSGDDTNVVLETDAIVSPFGLHPKRRMVVLKHRDGFYSVAEQYYYADTHEGSQTVEGWATLPATGIFATIELAEHEAITALEGLRLAQS